MPPSRFYKITWKFKDRLPYPGAQEKEYRMLCLGPTWKAGDFREFATTEAWRDMEQLIVQNNEDITELPPFSALHLASWIKTEKDKKGNTVYRDKKSNKLVEKQLICLRELDCSFSSLRSLPALPEGLEVLTLRGMPNLRKLPRLPSSLKVLDIRDTPLTELPELPESLLRLYGAECLPRKWQRDSVLFTSREDLETALGYDVEEDEEDVSTKLCTFHKEQGYEYILLDALWHYRELHNQKVRARARAARIKKQLVENVFHPRRVWKWIEAGLEVEDM